jgi:hypothetical protein
MGRLSGFFIWSATFLLAVFSVCQLPDELTYNSMPLACRRIEATAQNVDVRFAEMPQRHSRDAEAAGPEPDQGVVCRIVAPAGCLIVVGSADVSGAAHEVSVESRRSASCCKLPASVSDAIPVTAEVWKLDSPARETHPNGNMNARRNSSFRLLTDAKAASSDRKSRDGSNIAKNTASINQRRFLMPHFEADAVLQEPALATAICGSEHVTVFMDDQLFSSEGTANEVNGGVRRESVDAEDTVENATRICDIIETQLMDTISDWIHPVSDLDNDGRLAIVMTDLDRRSVSGETPVLGCVRERDFQEHATADFAGDIVYLDYRLPQGDELTALLAHELTHAAIASLHLKLSAQPNRRPHRIPPWLNEAVAHWVELQFCEEPTGFSDRVQQFQANPAACPIVAPEALVPLATRRAGSRISAVSFLQQCINEPRNIHRLLRSERAFDETMSHISGKPFEAIFRSWSVEQGLQFQQSASRYSHPRLKDGLTTTTTVHGTSFVVVGGGDTACDVTVTAQSSAQLQVTLLMSDCEDAAGHQVTATPVTAAPVTSANVD